MSYTVNDFKNAVNKVTVDFRSATDISVSRSATDISVSRSATDISVSRSATDISVNR